MRNIVWVLFMCVIAVALQAAVVVNNNPGFESPATDTSQPATSAELGWVTLAATNVPFDAGVIASGVGGEGVALTSPDGDQHAYFNVANTPVAADVISLQQTLGNSQIGRTYTVSFSYAHSDPTFKNTVAVTVNIDAANRLVATTDIAAANMTWNTATSVQYTATTAAPIYVYLRFTNRSAGDAKTYIDSLNLSVNSDVAYTPNPATGTSNIDNNVDLTWIAGEGAVSHDVYFGTDVYVVNDADITDQLGVYKGRQSDAVFDPGTLPLGGSFAWRIDEVKADSSIIKGAVWVFNTRPYVTIDDMSGYDDTANPITATWIAGANSSVVMAGAELTFRPGGTTDTKSLKLNYNNSVAPYYSQATRTFAVPMDFTQDDTKAVVFYIHGVSTNSDEAVYMTLEDSLSNSASVVIHDPNSIAQAVNEPWLQHNIDMQDFTDANVNMTSIKKISVGVGNRISPVQGGSGAVYFDVIRRYISRCLPAMVVGDMNNDCSVDLMDFAVVADRWLDTATVIYPVEPAEPNNLVFVYHFDQTGGTVVYDGTVLAPKFDGVINGNFSWDTSGGYDGGCLTFTGEAAGTGTRVKVLKDSSNVVNVMSNITDQITISMWINGNVAAQPANSGALFHHKKGSSLNLICYGPYLDGNFYWTAGSSVDRLIYYTAGAHEYEGQWNHYAFVKNVTTGEMKIYVNGVLGAEKTGAHVPLTGGEALEFSIGGLTGDAGLNYAGKIDQFRLYSRALTAPEIVWLADKSFIGQPLVTPADINKDNVVGLDDMLLMATNWANVILWP